MFAATCTLSVSWLHLSDLNLLIRSVYRFHVHFYIQLILHELCISLRHEIGFNNVKNSFIQSGYYSLCHDYRVNSEETCMGIGFIQQIMLFVVMK